MIDEETEAENPEGDGEDSPLLLHLVGGEERTAMSWKNYPSEFKCDDCNGRGDVACSCCGEESECSECDGEGMIGIDFNLMREQISKAPSIGPYGGIGELIENDVWVGRTDGLHKWYYRDFAINKEASTPTK